MGAEQSQSSSKAEVILNPQQETICATQARFCLPSSVQLRLKEKILSLSGDDFQITDMAGTMYFQCQGKIFSLRDKKVLRDNAGVPVMNLKEQLFTFKDKFKVFAGDESSQEICKINTDITFIRAKMTAQFTDVINNQSRVIVLTGSWREKRCMIFLGEPKQGGIPIARIYRPTTGRSILSGADEYYIEIAAGVDIALMVIMCIALDEHQRD